jgi:DNA-directed RNA polymerase specialized sigma subunit
VAHSDPPTRGQLSYLRDLADKTGTTFSMPRTRGEASDEIGRLKKLARSSRQERRDDRDAVSRSRREQQPTSSVRDDEIAGYGSQARWANGN